MYKLVSICIPAYKNTSYLERLLLSILNQTYTNVEVIVSDDSPDNTVETFLLYFESNLKIKYYKNNPSLGTPANWNFAMEQARGQYIKLIHDDDWLATDNALALMVDALEKNPEADFVFSAYTNVQLETNTTTTVTPKDSFLNLVRKNPLNLFRENIIGPPSVIMHRSSFDFDYDEKLKWVVDFEAYMRALQSNHQFIFIDTPLINIGISSVQVTKASSRIREVEIPENLYMLQKQGLKILNNIWVYDYYWRLLRNVSIREEKDITNAGWQTDIPLPLKRMLGLQKWIPLAFLSIGAFSKSLMFLCYFTSKRN